MRFRVIVLIVHMYIIGLVLKLHTNCISKSGVTAVPAKGWNLRKHMKITPTHASRKIMAVTTDLQYTVCGIIRQNITMSSHYRQSIYK